jgi:hypothetical protein
MNQTSVITKTDLRETARAWLEDVLTNHLHPELARGNRIQQVAAAFEKECRERGLPVEVAVTMAADWANDQNDEAGLTHAAQN